MRWEDTEEQQTQRSMVLGKDGPATSVAAVNLIAKGGFGYLRGRQTSFKLAFGEEASQQDDKGSVL